ncbi:DNA internalization-related competence protein ComEC/Rec2 [Candidatus Methylocalor cossyra]|uniref:Competence protein ComEC n=1 Tax=Candidatus Methylocalor cossyra TaxID=3108543 RepID=A0ABM9NLJ5_9GAMM
MNVIAPSAAPALVRVAAGFVTGVSLVEQLPALPSPGLGGGLLLWFVLCPWRRWPGWTALVVGLGWALAYGSWRLSGVLPAAAARQTAQVEGRVVSLPDTMERGVRFDFTVERVLEPAGLVLPDRLRLSWYDPPAAAPKAGQRWRLRVSLRRPHGTLNPGGFDYEGWLFAQGIGAVGYVRESAANARLAEGVGVSLPAWRQRLYDGLARVLEGSPYAGLIEALTLGADGNITAAQWEVLRRTGTAHLIAISGSHIGLVAAVAFFVTQKLAATLGVLRCSPPSLAAGAGVLAALSYAALADFAIPTQRALIMVGIAMGAVWLRRALAFSQVLALALVAVVAYDPLAVLAPGLWLSFAAVALIGLAVAGRVEPPRGWRALVAINWVTALGLAPLLLLLFGQIPLIAPVANLLAVPVLGTLLVPLCLAGALLLPLAPGLGGGLLQGAEAILSWIWPLLERLSAVPWAQWSRAEPPPWTFPPAVLGAVLMLAPRGIPGRWLGLVLLLPALAAGVPRPAPGQFRLALLDVGQGLAAVLETHHRTLVFDTGARLGPNFDMGGAVVGPYLRQRGIRDIDLLIISHGDSDHSGGARTLAAQFPVALALTSAPEQLPDLMAAPCRAGQEWTWDGVRFAMLGPTGGLEKENDASCVLRVEGRNGSALLTGDIERASEERLVARYGAGLGSAVLVVPHHGSNSSSTRAFLAAVRPSLALIPAGPLNRFGFPHPQVLERYRAIGAQVLSTAESGAILVTVGDGPLRWEAYRVTHRRYWNAP